MRRLLFALAIPALAMLAPAWAGAGEAEDDALAHQIASNLKTSGQMADYEVGIACMDGTAWLSGRVTSQEQAAAALEIAQKTEGVQRVIDRMEIGAVGQKSEAISDKLKAFLPAAEKKEASAPIKREPSAVQQTSAATPEVPQPLVPQGAAQPVSAARQPVRQANTPVPYGYTGGAQFASANAPVPAFVPGMGGHAAPAQYDHPHMPGYAWPSYAAYPNYAALTYPKQYSPTAWPYIGPFYPYPQVPLGWRKVTLEWDDGWWMLDFKD